MRIVVFGATGKTGRHVVDRALAFGLEVVALARRPDAVVPRPGLQVVQGDVLDMFHVRQALARATAAICAIGPAQNGNPGNVISEGVRNILQGCADERVGRFVFESGIMMSDGKDLSLLGSYAAGLFRVMYPKLHEEKVRAEQQIQRSTINGTEWVIVRPPALRDTPATGKYVVGPGARVFPASSLPYADCADVLVKAATRKEWVNQIINVGRS